MIFPSLDYDNCSPDTEQLQQTRPGSSRLALLANNLTFTPGCDVQLCHTVLYRGLSEPQTPHARAWLAASKRDMVRYGLDNILLSLYFCELPCTDFRLVEQGMAMWRNAKCPEWTQALILLHRGEHPFVALPCPC